MKISLNWLKDYISFDIPDEDFLHKLTMAGIEVEDVYDYHGDKVFEVEVTPNRADCLNIIGIAREVSAILNKTKKMPTVKKNSTPKAKCDIQIQAKDKCERYIGAVVADVSISSSPEWIQERLQALGVRPINNVVDITNFSLFENGQPLHAFDYDKLEGGKIIVRFAKKGEKIITLDGIERELDPTILIIADAKKPVAIAGIMGGKNSEVTNSTKNILLESAHFNQVLIRRTSRKLALSSDSSYRFERGVNFEGIDYGSKRAVGLILEIAGGKLSEYQNCQVKKKVARQKVITISLDDINAYLGAKITAAKCQSILKKLEFKITTTKNNVFKVTAPCFRTDINEEVDIIEEVSRVIGYDNLPMTLPSIKATNLLPRVSQTTRKQIAKSLIAQGLSEIITYSMINQEALDKCYQSDLKGIKILNPLTQDQEMMRPTMLASLLPVVQFNLNKGQKNLKLFEIGKIYSGNVEKDTLAIVMVGDSQDDWRSDKNRQIDYFDLKGVVEQALLDLGISTAVFESCVEKFLEDEAAVLRIKSKQLGTLGKISEDVLSNWGIKQPNVWFAQIDLSRIYEDVNFEKRFQPISDYPAIVRDVSLSVKQEVSFQDILDVVYKNGGSLLKDVSLTEEYVGDKIADGQRGIVFSLQYQSNKRTLTEGEVNGVHDKISQALIDCLDVVKR